MIRPEVAAIFLRWRDAVVGGALILWGGYLWRGAYGTNAWVAGGVIALGVVLIATGIPRGLFRQKGDGSGLVSIDEGRISYLGPLDGGIIDMDDLRAIAIDRTQMPPTWVFSTVGQADIYIPVNASGAEQLFDVFSELPDLPVSRVVREVNSSARDKVVIWRK